VDVGLAEYSARAGTDIPHVMMTVFPALTIQLAHSLFLLSVAAPHLSRVSPRRDLSRRNRQHWLELTISPPY